MNYKVFMTCLIVFFIMLISKIQPVAGAVTAGINFTENAFVDTILSTDFTGTCGTVRNVSGLTLEDAIVGSNLYTWLEYGEHDLLPGEDGDYNSDAPPTQYIELGFTDNTILNGPSNDIALFEYGTANSILVALDLSSIQNPYLPQSKALVVNPMRLETNINVGYVDLSDLDIELGQAVNKIFISSALGENGEVYWNMPGFPNWGVPEVSAVGALYNEEMRYDYILNIPVKSGAADAEENDFGEIIMDSPVLTLGATEAGKQLVGIRIAAIEIPQNAIITNAYIEFEADQAQVEQTSLTISCENSATPEPFSTTPYDLSNRLKQTAAVHWDNIEAWEVKGKQYRTPDISVLIQKNVDLDEWRYGNPMALFFEGTGLRIATSYDGESVAAPNFHVEYTLGGIPNQAPTVSAGDDFTAPLFAQVALLGTAEDDGFPYGNFTVSWRYVDGPGTVQFSSKTSLRPTAVFDTPGTYVLTLSADDGEAVSSDRLEVDIVDLTPPSTPLNFNAIVVSDVRIDLDWDEASDNVGVAGYAVYRDTKLLGTTQTTDFSDTDCLPSTTYTYYVEAFDSEGNYSEKSASISVTTFDPTPIEDDNPVDLPNTEEPSPDPIEDQAANQAPTVDAGNSVTVFVAQSVMLKGVVTDDGLPEVVIVEWSCVSGGGESVTFSSPSTPEGAVIFNDTGNYVLQLKAFDGERTVVDNIEVTVIADDDNYEEDIGPASSTYTDNGGKGGCFIHTL